MDELCSGIIFEAFSLLFGVIGGGFALFQWRRSVIYKRTEIVRDLIADVRGNETIATIMDIIDWNKGFIYNGSFSVVSSSSQISLGTITDDKLMKMIDYTLSLFSYICYLKEARTIKNKEMYFFEYEIRRLMDNPQIQNYLYSLYHWSAALGVHMSFSHLISYGIKRGYLAKSFYVYMENHPDYHCYLVLPTEYVHSKAA